MPDLSPRFFTSAVEVAHYTAVLSFLPFIRHPRRLNWQYSMNLRRVEVCSFTPTCGRTHGANHPLSLTRSRRTARSTILSNSSHATSITSQRTTTWHIVSFSIRVGCRSPLQLTARAADNIQLARFVLSGRGREREGGGICPVVDVRPCFLVKCGGLMGR